MNESRNEWHVARKINLNQIKSSIDSNKDPHTLMFYRNNKNHIKSYLIYKPSKNFELDKFWKKELKLGLNLERVEKKILRNEEAFYNNHKNDSSIFDNYVKKFSDKIAEENLKTPKTLDIEETGGKNLNFIGHKRKPFYCINLLSTKAVSVSISSKTPSGTVNTALLPEILPVVRKAF